MGSSKKDYSITVKRASLIKFVLGFAWAVVLWVFTGLNTISTPIFLVFNLPRFIIEKLLGRIVYSFFDSLIMSLPASYMFLVSFALVGVFIIFTSFISIPLVFFIYWIFKKIKM